MFTSTAALMLPSDPAIAAGLCPGPCLGCAWTHKVIPGNRAAASGSDDPRPGWPACHRRPSTMPARIPATADECRRDCALSRTSVAARPWRPEQGMVNVVADVALDVRRADRSHRLLSCLAIRRNMNGGGVACDKIYTAACLAICSVGDRSKYIFGYTISHGLKFTSLESGMCARIISSHLQCN